mmetsp:Transcript_141741/g.369508  ORF Transcript_141741/g.369508 Transcript_141741/m.369508 type:complete len:272 (-) Transcript_141741:1024-1839(-)
MCSPSHRTSSDCGQAWLPSAATSAAQLLWKWPRGPAGADMEWAPEPRFRRKLDALEKPLEILCSADRKRRSSEALFCVDKTCWNFLLASKVKANCGASGPGATSASAEAPRVSRREPSMTAFTRDSVCWRFSSQGGGATEVVVLPNFCVVFSAPKSRVAGCRTWTFCAGARVCILPVPGGTQEVAPGSGRATLRPEVRATSSSMCWAMGLPRNCSGRGTSGLRPVERMSRSQASRYGLVQKAHSRRWLMHRALAKRTGERAGVSPRSSSQP